jgi:periplasmic copper chaperone A
MQGRVGFSTLCGAAMLLSVAIVPMPAGAHVVFDKPEVAPGELATAALRVTHGCNGSSTTRIEITIPDEITRVNPRALSGWIVSRQMRRLEQPITQHGTQITEVISKLVWTGGPLMDGEYQEFEFRYQAPSQPDRTIYFPVEQVCEQGKTSWTNIPRIGQRWGDVKEPAPYIRVILPAVIASPARARRP